jgi:hypothetical protein
VVGSVGFNAPGVLSEAFDLQVFCHGQERVQIFLRNVHLAVVHELEDRLKILLVWFHSLQTTTNHY